MKNYHGCSVVPRINPKMNPNNMEMKMPKANEMKPTFCEKNIWKILKILDYNIHRIMECLERILTINSRSEIIVPKVIDITGPI